MSLFTLLRNASHATASSALPTSKTLLPLFRYFNDNQQQRASEENNNDTLTIGALAVVIGLNALDACTDTFRDNEPQSRIKNRQS